MTALALRTLMMRKLLTPVRRPRADRVRAATKAVTFLTFLLTGHVLPQGATVWKEGELLLM